MRTGQREFEVLLPIGYTDEAGRVHRRAVIRKMRGHEEALLYDPSLTAGRLVTELIQSCLVRLGDLESIDSDVVSQLYTADRNYLLLELRQITLGNQLRTSYLCPRCNGNVSVLEDLSQIEVRRLDEGQTLADVTPLAIIDLLAVLPFYLPFFGVDLRFVRGLRLFRLLRLAKLSRYLEAIQSFGRVFKAKKEELTLAVGLSLIFTAIMMIAMPAVIKATFPVVNASSTSFITAPFSGIVESTPYVG